MELLEALTGGRVTHAMNTIGGVRRDIPADVIPKVKSGLDYFEKEPRNT